MQSTALAFTAERFLLILKDDPDTTRTLERYYVQIAYKYGVEVERIAHLSGIPVATVRELLLDNA